MSTTTTQPTCPLCGEAQHHPNLCPRLQHYSEILDELLRCRALLRDVRDHFAGKVSEPIAESIQDRVRARLAWPKEGR